jgi:hypothetical protein
VAFRCNTRAPRRDSAKVLNRSTTSCPAAAS